MDDLDVRNLGWRVVRVLASIALGIGAAVGIAVAFPNYEDGYRGTTMNPFAVFAGFVGLAIGCHVGLAAIAARIRRARRVRTLIPVARAIISRRTHRA